MQKELIFTVTFFFVLGAVGIFLGSTITGFTTMHCEDGVCKETCRFDTDCDSGEVCCDKGLSQGVCEQKCVKRFEYKPTAQDPSAVDYQVHPAYESPASTNHTMFFVGLLVVVIIAGVIYHKIKSK